MIVLPGIMGSELVDATSGKTLWGLADPGWYLRAWTSGSSLDALRVTDEERAGSAGRIKATRLLQFPAFAPVLRGFEPYTALVRSIRRVVLDPAAVLSFAYDWRLSTAHNARILADAAENHLRMWRAHPRGSAGAKLVLVAHSMGGLVARYFTGVLGGDSEVRTTVTLGTPFRGAVKAALILSSGRGSPVPLPRSLLRRLCATMPGLHDLLPSYRCVLDGTRVRRLIPSDVTALGGDEELAEDAARLHDQLTAVSVDRLRTVVGVGQPTMQSLTVEGGAVTPQLWAYQPGLEPGQMRFADRGGDETVYRESAAGGVEPLYLAQSHGALASTSEAVSHVCGVLTEEPLGPWLGAPSSLGLHVPDMATVGEPIEIVASSDEDFAAVTCRVTDARSGAPIAYPMLTSRDGTLKVRLTVDQPGVYRVALKGEAFSPVTQLVMVTPRAPEVG
ncbi:hypothetical protein OG985_04940 [Streptomyces sp. NBC_00289]|uniref:esterase/lipase family protein n=1 Tax=Streptomyces sp. NBC_00289 TaxID=2975703 RepID=UPI00324E842B